jgi:hypothetical protein
VRWEEARRRVRRGGGAPPHAPGGGAASRSTSGDRLVGELGNRSAPEQIRRRRRGGHLKVNEPRGTPAAARRRRRGRATDDWGAWRRRGPRRGEARGAAAPRGAHRHHGRGAAGGLRRARAASTPPRTAVSAAPEREGDRRPRIDRGRRSTAAYRSRSGGRRVSPTSLARGLLVVGAGRGQAAGGSPLPPSHAASSSQEQGGLRPWRSGSSPFGAEGGGGVTGEREAVEPTDGWDGERPQHSRECGDRRPCCKMQQLLRLLLETVSRAARPRRRARQRYAGVANRHSWVGRVRSFELSGARANEINRSGGLAGYLVNHAWR